MEGRRRRCAFFVLWSLFGFGSTLSWQDRPKLFAHLTPRDFQSFSGILKGPNSSLNSSDYLTTMLYTNVVDDLLIVGARNIMYKLDPREFRVTQTMRWPPVETEVDRCHVKGKTQAECQNYIKVLKQFDNDPDKFLVCGTNAFKPVCREYFDERGSYVLRNEKSGLGLAPFSHLHNSTAVLVDGKLFAGTVADFQGVDPIIFRDPLRTVQYDSRRLNRPDFVGSFENKDFVYFFFREAAVEYINCGKAVFSRVARVCKSDPGFTQNSRSGWTSFFKARLNCSVPGDFPFYLDQIQSVSDVVTGRYGPSAASASAASASAATSINKARDGRSRKTPLEEVLYATFSTPSNGIVASAVCAFRLKDIEAAFQGRFKKQQDWTPVPDRDVPSPRPGLCLNDSRSITEKSQTFIKEHTLMEETVNAFFGAPVVVRSGVTSSTFTAIVVDSQIGTTDGGAFDVLFVGTTNGRVLKVINARSNVAAAEGGSDVGTVVIEELQVFAHDVPVKELRVMNSRGRHRSLGRLAVLVDGEVRSVAVQRCDRAASCQECVALQDPYCAWDASSARCGSGDWDAKMSSGFIQAVATGVHAFCPVIPTPTDSSSEEAARAADSLYAYTHVHGEPPPPIGEVVNILQEDDKATKQPARTQLGDAAGSSHVTLKESPHSFSLETLVITVSAAAVAALVVGFVTGYCCGRRCHKEEAGGLPHMPAFQETDYEYFEQHGGLSRPAIGRQPPPGLGRPLLVAETAKLDNCQEEVTYAEPELVTGGFGDLNGGGSGPLNSRYVGGGGVVAQSPHYTSSLLAGPSKFNTIHSGANKRGGGLNAPNHYESAADRVVGGSGLKDYTRIGEGGGPLLALRERDFLNQNHNLINSGSNAPYQMSTLGRGSSMRGCSLAPVQPKNPDPTMMLFNTTAPSKAGPGAASTTSAGGSSSSSGGGMSLLNSNEDGSLRSGGGNAKRPQVVDSAYGTTRSTRNKVYL